MIQKQAATLSQHTCQYKQCQYDEMAHNIYKMQEISAEIQEFLKEKRLDSEITDFINHLQAKTAKPTIKFHQINPETILEPTLVYAHLMVQDIRDVYYYISLAVRKNYNPNDGPVPFCLYKYGNMLNNEPANIQDNKQYIHVMTDRYPVICTPVRYQTQWANHLQGNINKQTQIILEVDGRADYKLGEIINVVALYDPHIKKLFMVRQLTEEEAFNQGLEVISELVKGEVNYEKIRQELMHILCQYSSEIFAEYLLITLISEEPLFLGCEANISELVSEIYPRVAHIKLVHPCNASLFPYKNEEGELQIAPMQMSSLSTFVILDLSQFSNKEKVLIKEGELQNFSALKMFVEEGKTIYRWEIGESQVDHKHNGLIVKAAQLITPHFNPRGQNISPDFSNLSKIPEETKMQIRTYLQSVMNVNPTLAEDQRKKIEKQLSGQKSKEKIGTNLGSIMRISKLLARSFGRSVITFEDFLRAKELIEFNQSLKV